MFPEFKASCLGNEGSMTDKSRYSDVRVSVHGEDRIIAGLDIPLLLHGQPRPLWIALRAMVSMRCSVVDVVQMAGDRVILLIGMMGAARIFRLI